MQLAKIITEIYTPYFIKKEKKEERKRRAILLYFLEKNLTSLFGKKEFSPLEIEFMRTNINQNEAIIFLFNGKKYNILVDHLNRLTMDNQEEGILFRITLDEEESENFLVTGDDEKKIKEYQKIDVQQEIFSYHKTRISDTLEINYQTMIAKSTKVVTEGRRERVKCFSSQEQKSYEKKKGFSFIEKFLNTDILFIQKENYNDSLLYYLPEIFEDLERRCNEATPLRRKLR